MRSAQCTAASDDHCSRKTIYLWTKTQSCFIAVNFKLRFSPKICPSRTLLGLAFFMAVKRALCRKGLLCVCHLHKNLSLRGASLLEFCRKTVSSIAARKCYLCIVINFCYNRRWLFYRLRLCDRKMERKGRDRLFNKIISFVYFWYALKKGQRGFVACKFTCMAVPVISGEVTTLSCSAFARLAKRKICAGKEVVLCPTVHSGQHWWREQNGDFSIEEERSGSFWKRRRDGVAMSLRVRKFKQQCMRLLDLTTPPCSALGMLAKRKTYVRETVVLCPTVR